MFRKFCVRMYSASYRSPARRKQGHAVLHRMADQLLEERCCPSAVGFIEHPVVCCLGRSHEMSAAADFDGDGDIDLVSAAPGDGLLVWLENRDGSFRASHQTRDVGGRLQFLSVTDFDGDGDADVVTDFGWYENRNGRGDFSLRTDFGIDGTVAALADMNGDSIADLVGFS